jgi:hypothetical protein
MQIERVVCASDERRVSFRVPSDSGKLTAASASEELNNEEKGCSRRDPHGFLETSPPSSWPRDFASLAKACMSACRRHRPPSRRGDEARIAERTAAVPKPGGQSRRAGVLARRASRDGPGRVSFAEASAARSEGMCILTVPPATLQARHEREKVAPHARSGASHEALGWPLTPQRAQPCE